MVWLSVDKRGRLRLSLAVVGFGSVLHCSVWPPCICPMLQLLFPWTLPFLLVALGLAQMELAVLLTIHFCLLG